MTEPPPPPPPPPFDPGPAPGPGWWLAADGRWYPPDKRPGYAYPGPWGPAPQVAGPAGTWNGYAIAAFVLGLVWAFWIGSILALIFGPIAIGQIGRSGNRQRGRGLAVAGIVLGALGIAFLILGIIGAALNPDRLR